MLNAWAINEAELNGSREIFGEGAVQVALSVDGELSVGLSLIGQASIEHAVTGQLNAFLQGEGEPSDIGLQADLPPMVRRFLEGDAQTSIEADGEAQIRFRPTSTAQVEIASEADGKAVPPASATFNVRTTATGSADVITATWAEGQALIQVTAWGRLDRRRAIHAGADVITFVSGWGRACVRAQSHPGTAILSTEAAGEARLGGKLSGSGRATIQSLATARHEAWHHVYAECRPVIITLSADDAGFGKPALPTEFYDAPAARTMYVPPPTRDMAVPSDERIAS